VAHPLEPLLREVADVVSNARAACDAMARHPGLQRTLPVLQAEAALRAARAGLALDGIELALYDLRDIARGLATPPYGPAGSMVTGALRLQVELVRAIGGMGEWSPTPAQPLPVMLASWHAVATSALGSGEPGRMRDAEQPADLEGLGDAPVGEELARRMAGLAELVAAPLSRGMSGLVVAAVMHGELLVTRPFPQANGMVARALLRWQLARTGVDRTGTVVPEAVWADAAARHRSVVAGFATGEWSRAVAWVRWVSAAVTQGADVALALAEDADRG
jgi:hypothetical protein